MSRNKIAGKGKAIKLAWVTYYLMSGGAGRVCIKPPSDGLSTLQCCTHQLFSNSTLSNANNNYQAPIVLFPFCT